MRLRVIGNADRCESQHAFECDSEMQFRRDRCVVVINVADMRHASDNVPNSSTVIIFTESTCPNELETEIFATNMHDDTIGIGSRRRRRCGVAFGVCRTR